LVTAQARDQGGIDRQVGVEDAIGLAAELRQAVGRSVGDHEFRVDPGEDLSLDVDAREDLVGDDDSEACHGVSLDPELS